jgi:hypothetical protein
LFNGSNVADDDDNDVVVVVVAAAAGGESNVDEIDSVVIQGKSLFFRAWTESVVRVLVVVVVSTRLELKTISGQ